MSLLARCLRLLPRRTRDRLLRSFIKVDDAALADVTVRVADTVDELQQAARILHDAYVARGYVDPHPAGVRTTPHLVLPTTTTFVAKRGATVIGTLALIQDGPLGLPMEKIYGAEVAPLRRTGRRLAEVGALCVAPGHRRRGIAFLLNKLMFHCAKDLLGVEDLLIAVRWDAEDLYRAALLFERLGDVRQYPGLKRAARGVALRLPLTGARERYRGVFAGLPPAPHNPYWLYVQRHDPQLEIPTDAGFLLRMRHARVLAGAWLVAARPDAFAELDPLTHVLLRMALPIAALPALAAPLDAPAAAPVAARDARGATSGRAPAAAPARVRTRTFGFPVAEVAS